MAVFTNQATLSYNGVVRSSNITTGEILEALSVTKTALGNSYAPFDKVTYVVSIVNNGTAAYNSLTVTDDLGGMLSELQRYIRCLMLKARHGCSSTALPQRIPQSQQDLR